MTGLALLEDSLKDSTATAGLAAAGGLVLAPLVVSWVVQPMLRIAVQTGAALYSEAVAPMGSALAGLVAEARAELADRGGPRGTASRPEPMAEAPKEPRAEREAKEPATTGRPEGARDRPPRRPRRAKQRKGGR
jgi:hypothetical protein